MYSHYKITSILFISILTITFLLKTKQNKKIYILFSISAQERLDVVSKLK